MYDLGVISGGYLPWETSSYATHCDQSIYYKRLSSIFNMDSDDIFYWHLRLFFIIFNIENDCSLLAFNKTIQQNISNTISTFGREDTFGLVKHFKSFVKDDLSSIEKFFLIFLNCTNSSMNALF